MSTRRFLKTSLGLFAAVLMFGAAQAEPINPPNMDKMVGRRIEHIAHAVNASPEQKAKLLAVAKAAQLDLKPLHEQLKAGHEQMMVLMSATTLDRAAIEQRRQQQVATTDAISRRMVQLMVDSAEVLTPEQRTKFAAMMKNRQGRMERVQDKWQHRAGPGHQEPMLPNEQPTQH